MTNVVLIALLIISIVMNVVLAIYIRRNKAPTNPQGTILIDMRHAKSDGYVRYGFKLDGDPIDLKNQKTVIFRIDDKAVIGDYDNEKLSDGPLL